MSLRVVTVVVVAEAAVAAEAVAVAVSAVDSVAAGVRAPAVFEVPVCRRPAWPSCS